MDICLECGRRIRLMSHGNFRKHNISKGNICLGSWKFPRRQREVAQQSVQRIGGTRLHIVEGCDCDECSALRDAADANR